MFPERLRTERELRGLSRRDLALLSGVNERSIINYENAVNDPPLTQAARLARALEISVDDLLDPDGLTIASFGRPNPRELLEESMRLQQLALMHLGEPET